jgi:hypothetical protein
MLKKKPPLVPDRPLAPLQRYPYYPTFTQLKKELVFKSYFYGKIIYVYGSSTSGKSTFTKNLNSFLPNCTLVSTKEMKIVYAGILIERMCGPEYQYVSKYFDIYNLLCYLDGMKYKILIPPLNQEKLISALKMISSKFELIKQSYNPTEFQQLMYGHIFSLSKENKNVIVDDININDFISYKEIKQLCAPITFVLLYCPLDRLLPRVMERNQIAKKNDETDVRSTYRPFETFFNLYKQVNNRPFIEEIPNDNLLHILFQAIPVAEDMEMNAWRKITHIISSYASDESSVKLQARYLYDILLDTGKSNPAEMLSRFSNVENNPKIKK